MRPSDEPVLNAAPAAAREDHDAVRAAIAQSEALAAQSSLRSLLREFSGFLRSLQWAAKRGARACDSQSQKLIDKVWTNVLK